MYYDGPMMNGYGWGWGIIGSLLWLGFFVFVALLVYRLVREGPVNPRHGRDPLGIAKERYAKGEIDKEQFEQLKKDLANKN
jgi:putative membrane protein